MVEQRWGAGAPWAEQIALGSGVLFVILALIAFVLAGGPETDATGEEIISYFRENENTIKWQGALFGLAGAVLLWFGGSLAAAIRRAEGDPAGRIPAILVAATGASVALYLTGVGTWTALAKTSAEEGTTRALFDLGDIAFALSSFTAATFIWAASTGIMRTRLLPDWVGWFGTVLAIFLVVDGFIETFSDDVGAGITGQIAFMGFLAWILIASVLLTLGVRRAALGERTVLAP
jgi:hypothetical protein